MPRQLPVVLLLCAASACGPAREQQLWSGPADSTVYQRASGQTGDVETVTARKLRFSAVVSTDATAGLDVLWLDAAGSQLALTEVTTQSHTPVALELDTEAPPDAVTARLVAFVRVGGGEPSFPNRIIASLSRADFSSIEAEGY